MTSYAHMRTTVNLENEILDTCRDLADQQGVSLGDAVGLLVRRGLAYRSPYRERNGFAVQKLPFASGPGPGRSRSGSRQFRHVRQHGASLVFA